MRRKKKTNSPFSSHPLDVLWTWSSKKSKYSFVSLSQLSLIGRTFIGLLLITLFASLLENWTGRLALFLIGLLLISLPILRFAHSRYLAAQEEGRIRALKVSEVDSMAGHAFEHYVALLLRSQGYATTVTKGSGDSGVDVIARKTGVSYAIQCKHSINAISRRAISDAVAGVAHYNCTNSMVVTNRFFTRGAKSLASSNKCILVDRDLLAAWIQEWQCEARQQRIQPNA
jgi:restriction system protein